MDEPNAEKKVVIAEDQSKAIGNDRSWGNARSWCKRDLGVQSGT